MERGRGPVSGSRPGDGCFDGMFKEGSCHNRLQDSGQGVYQGVEVMGYTAREDLPEADYDADKDISFYPGLAESYIPVKPGMFAIFFPQDAHAPGVSPDGVKKVIVKVLV